MTTRFATTFVMTNLRLLTGDMSGAFPAHGGEGEEREVLSTEVGLGWRRVRGRLEASSIVDPVERVSRNGGDVAHRGAESREDELGRSRAGHGGLAAMSVHKRPRCSAEIRLGGSVTTTLGVRRATIKV